jgi:tetratricopeptide (TPR) repeat protein
MTASRFRRRPKDHDCSTKLSQIAGFATLCWCLVLAALSSSLAVAQTADINQRFRQATQEMRSGQLDAAAEGFAAVAAAAPDFAEAHFNLGLVREEQGRNEEAIASLQKALALKPHLHGANLFLGVAEYRLNQFDKGAAALKKETTSFPKDATAWMWLGVIRLAQEQPEEAAAALDRAAKLDPNNVDILYQRGRAHLLISKDSYEQMFKADPKSWRVHQVIAQADAEAGRHDDAIAEYLAAIQIVPTQPGLHEELGTEYLKAGKLDDAEAALKRELDIDPHNVLATYKLGTLEAEQGEGARSKELLQNALRQNPDLKDSAYYLGRAEMELGNNEAAAVSFERETADKSATPAVVQQAWYQLGIVYRRLRRIEDAQRAFAEFQRRKDDASRRLQERVQKKEETQTDDAQPHN